MEIFFLVILILAVTGAGWIWQVITEIVQDIHRSNWNNRVYGQVASQRALRKNLGGHDFNRLYQVYDEFARRFEGRLHDRRLLESPKVSYTHQASRVLLSVYETSDDPPQFYTQVLFTMPSGWPHRLEVYPQRLREGDVKVRNVEDITIGDPEFDPRYIVKSDNPEFARTFFDRVTIQAIEDLRNFLGNDRILLSLNGSRLLVRKASVIASFDDLMVLARLSANVYDRLHFFWQKISGIEILEEAGSEASPPMCQVCGVDIGPETTVFCRRCRTPHHDDCWSYNEGCSTFACGEKRFVKKYA